VCGAFDFFKERYILIIYGWWNGGLRWLHKLFHPKSARIFLIKVWLKIFKQTLIDRDRFLIAIVIAFGIFRAGVVRIFRSDQKDF
jgi:hypothetical protein